MGSKSKSIHNIYFVIIMLASIFILFLADPALAEESTVARSLSTTTPTGNSEFEVTLQISNLQAGGIVETLPEGFSFISTTHPKDQTDQSGQNLVFSVIGETEIIYRVKAPSSGSGTFDGKWDNVLDGSEGEIAASSVTVKASSSSSGGSGGTLNVTSNSSEEEETEVSSEDEELISANARTSGPETEQEEKLIEESKTSDSDVKSESETESETENAPFTSPASILLIFGAAACIINGNCKGGRR